MKRWPSLKAAFFWLLASNFFALGAVYFFRHLPLRVSAGSEHWTQFHWQLRLWLFCGLPLVWTLENDIGSEDSDWKLSRLGFLLGFGLGPWLAGAFSFEQGMVFFPSYIALGLVSAGLLWPPDPRRVLRTLCLFNGLAFLHGIFALPMVLGTGALAAVLAFGLSPAGIRGGVFGFMATALGIALKIQIAWEGWRSMLLLGMLTVCGWIFAMRREASVVKTN